MIALVGGEISGETQLMSLNYSTGESQIHQFLSLSSLEPREGVLTNAYFIMKSDPHRRRQYISITIDQGKISITLSIDKISLEEGAISMVN